MDKMIETVKGLLDKVTFLPNYELKLAIIGGIVIFLVFLIALLVASGSKINTLRKRLLSSTMAIGAVQMVSEENVEIVYKELERLPEPVSKGWSCFMDQRFGYPSDYIPAKDVLSNRIYKGKNTVGLVMLNLFTLIVLCFGAFIVTGLCASDIQSVGLKDFTNDFVLISSIISTILIPILVWFVSYLLLSLRYNRQLKRLEMTYSSFQDILDDKVVIYASEEEAFVSENLDEIKKKVDELVAGRMDNIEIVDVISSPKVEDIEEIVSEKEPEVEVIETPIAEEVVAAATVVAPMTKEEERRYLEILLVVVDNAIADKETTPLDLESIAMLILTAKNEGFNNVADQKILDTCLEKIANLYFE